MMTDEPVKAITEPLAVDADKIESELEAIWRSIGTDEHSVTRATAFNLVYVTRKADPGDDPTELLSQLSLAHPARSILVLLTERKASPMAHVTAYCHRPQPDSPQICSESITIEADRRDPVATSSSIRALLLGGLPSTIVWHSSLAITHPMLRELADSVDRILTRAVELTEPASRLSILDEFWTKLRSGIHASDLIWSELSPWRNAIAKVFDCPDPTPRELSSVGIHYNGSKVTLGAVLLAGWIARSMNWQSSKITLKGKSSTVRFREGTALEFAGTPDAGITPSEHGKLTSIEFGFKLGQTASVTLDKNQLTTHAPHDVDLVTPYPETFLQILQRELSVLSHDPRRAAAYALARDWQKEILFS